VAALLAAQHSSISFHQPGSDGWFVSRIIRARPNQADCPHQPKNKRWSVVYSDNQFRCSMGRIQSGIGLVTGIPIADTVDQLIALAARPRNLLLERTAQLAQQQVGITALTALAIGVEFSINQLADESVFQARVASSSDSSHLSA